MWWVVGGVLIAAAALRWVAGRNRASDAPEWAERVERGYEVLRRRRRVAIGSAADGPVLIRGTVSADGAPLTAPVSQRPCVFYDVRVDDLMASGRSPSSTGPPAGSTAKLHRRRARPFLVTDETGAAEVRFDDPADVSFVVAAHLSLQGRRLRASTAVSEAVFKLGFLPTAAIAVSEAAIFIGDAVTVAGVGQREVAPGGEPAGYRDLPTRYVVRADATSVLAILKAKR